MQKTQSYQSQIESYGYKLVPRAEFFAATAEGSGEWLDLRDRATVHPGNYVLWDPEDDCDGLLLVGDDPEAMAREAMESIEPA